MLACSKGSAKGRQARAGSSGALALTSSRMADQIDDLALLEMLDSADETPPQIPSADIWAGDALSRAWSAAAAEFAVSGAKVFGRKSISVSFG